MRKIIFILALLCVISCKKELSLTGVAKFSFVNIGKTSYNNIHPRIFIYENGYTPLVDNITVNLKGETSGVELNFGNYYIDYRIYDSDNSYHLMSKKFQVQVNKTTHLVIDYDKE